MATQAVSQSHPEALATASAELCGNAARVEELERENSQLRARATDLERRVRVCELTADALLRGAEDIVGAPRVGGLIQLHDDNLHSLLVAYTDGQTFIRKLPYTAAAILDAMRARLPESLDASMAAAAA